MLKDKVALITGASRGIGKAIAMEFAANGANIAIIYAGNTDAANDTISEIEAKGVKAKAYQCDVSSFDNTKEIINQIIADFGQVDILVNNAGITKDGLMLSMSEQNFDAVINTNLKGAFNMIRHLYSHMMKRRSGRIINITSVAGIMDAAKTAIPMKRMGKPEEIAKAAVFLASDNATYITGEVLKIDGGLCM